MSEEFITFDSEELENYWNIYSDNFNKKYNSSKGSLIKFKEFLNREPSKFKVLQRISTSIDYFNEDIAAEKIHKLMEYIHYDYFVNFSKFVSDIEKYRESTKDIRNDEIFYNKLALLRSIKDGENLLKIFTSFYNYYINAILSVYEIVYKKKTEDKEELISLFPELYNRIDINIKIYHYDFYIEIMTMLKKSVIKIINAIYEDQSGCCVATPTFNILDILIELLRNLRKTID
jgi:hypothetical protein